MKKIALPLVISVSLYLAQSCTPRPEEDIPQIGDSLSTTVPRGEPSKTIEPADRQSDPSRVNYVLPMDTTYIAKDGDMTLIKVGGPLGDGCQQFEFIDSVKDGSALKLTFWASRPKDPNTVCTQQMQYVEKEVRIRTGEYSTLRVILPNGKEMTRPLSPQ
jgi:hypothetical protein